MSQLTQELIKSGYLTPEAKNKPVANTVSVPASDFETILSKFPEQYRWKLRAYTGEEIYYLYRICTYKPKLDNNGQLTNSSDGFILSQKARCFKWLRGELKSGVNSAVLNSIGRKFRKDFSNLMLTTLERKEAEEQRQQIEAFKIAFNAKRVRGAFD
jgi:hypothetical protein